MRFIRGDSLKEAIELFHTDPKLKHDGSVRSLELRMMLHRFTDVCNAIQYAHDRGILHRDIKPGNVIVGKYGETLVIDWGLAKPVGRSEAGSDAGERTLMPSSTSGSSATLPGSAMGTPAYMSPEQALGDLDRLGPRSDVYSLGATLYCLLTGKAPFEGEVVDVLRSVQRGDFTPPRGVDPSLSRSLEAICLTAMATKPEDRYVSCRALADDIERWSADEPVSVYREPFSTRATRWGRRHRTAAASLGMLMMTALVALAIGAVLINRERSRAEASFRQARGAVDKYFTTVSESRLLNVPGLQPLRKELLDAAQEYYQDFLSKRGDDPTVRAEAASALFRVSWITHSIGRPGDAIEPLSKALALYAQLIRSQPKVARYRKDAAVAHGLMGLILASQGRNAEALEAHDRALKIRLALLKEYPDDPILQNDVARTHHNIGNVYREEGKLDEALAEWDQALPIQQALLRSLKSGGDGPVSLTGRSGAAVMIREDVGRLQIERANVFRQRLKPALATAALGEARELFESLASERPAEQRLRASLADIYRNDGLIDGDAVRMEGAERSYRKSLAIFDQLAAANPDVNSYRNMQAEIQLDLTGVLVPLKRLDEALSFAREAVKGLEELLAAQPDSIRYRILLSQALTQVGSIGLKKGQANEVLPQLRRALEIEEVLAGEHPKNVRAQSSLAWTLRCVGRVESKTGHRAEARVSLERACKIEQQLAATYPAVRYNLACTINLIIAVAEPSEREELGARAVEELKRVLKDGFSNLQSLKTDPDLDSLRSRADFQSLIASLSAKAGSGK
jgi:serine/threonine protein kinase